MRPIAPVAAARKLWTAGAGTMLIGFCLLGLMPPFVKAAGDAGLTTAETVVARFAVGCVGAVLLSRLQQQALTTRQPRLLLLRGVLGGGAVFLYYVAVQRTGAGLGTLLNYTYGFWANLFGGLIGQRPRPGFWLLLSVAGLGAYWAIDPTVRGFGLGEAAALGSAVLAGGAVVCIKQLRETDGELAIVLSFCICGLLFAIVPAASTWQHEPARSLALWQTPTAWWLGLAVGASAFFGQVYFTRGYKHTTIQLGSILSLTTPLIAAVCGVIFLGETLAPRFWLGAALVGAASVALAWLERAPALASSTRAGRS